MELSTIKNKIRHYVDSSAENPIIVDVAGVGELISIEDEFASGYSIFVDASDYCLTDELPQMDKLLHDIANKNGCVFLTGLTTFLALRGEAFLKRTFRSMLDLHVKGKLVIITHGLGYVMEFDDPRIESRRLVRQNSIATTWPILCFVAPELASNFAAASKSINKVPLAVERDERTTIYVSTARTKSEFPNSLFPIKQYSSAYDIVIEKFPELSVVSREFGTKEEWEYLLAELDKYDGWSDYVEKQLGGKDRLLINIHLLTSTDKNFSWTFFLGLKLHGIDGNEYLAKAINRSATREEMLEYIYGQILEIKPKAKSFGLFYDERRKILKQMKVPTTIVVDFCKKCESKGAEGIHYLTDASQQEKETILKLTDQYGGGYGQKELERIIKTIYPDLAIYMSYYNYGNELLTTYFNAYKYNKVVNMIVPDLREMMEEQAVKRDFNLLLQHRSQLLSKMDLNHSKLYFVDALGVEFLSYIQDRCYAHGLSCDISIGRCSLPSITSENKDFIETFEKAGALCVSVKKLDDVKHAGTETYNYQNTKLPLHLIEEMRIIDEVIANIETELIQGEVEKVIVASDHGASRLAVINEKENKWEVSEKGLHSGRCCPVTDLSEKPEFATEQNGFWCLANYDRFKGGRKANVEVHGGATLEEVAIPIIAIRLAGNMPKCEIVESSKVITVSFKQKACVQLFVAKMVDDLQVCLNGKYYQAVPSEHRYIYNVPMDDVRRGSYTLDVYIGNNKIAQGLTFEVKSAGASENKYF